MQRMPGRPLVISFDLDDTLICYQPSVPCEPNRVPWVLRHWFGEPLRLGTAALLRELAGRGIRVWVFTSSYRSPLYIKWFFRFYGIRLSGVVNQELYDRLVTREFRWRPSKYPPAFGIDLHVDDSPGVGMEGEQHGFNVLVVRADDQRWAEQVLAAVDRLEAAKSG
jgi:hypothetical protein